MRLPSLPRRALPGFGLAAAAASAEPRLVLNDASRLSPTPVFSHWVARGDTEAGIIARLRAELAAARQAGRPLVVSAARHSMGGQSLPRDGHAITANGCVVEADTAARLYRASAGSRWHEVITWLDPLGFSPAVMQSNSDFGLGATFAVNAHGWPAPYGPFGSTVQSIRLMLADGEITDCSRTREPALFALAMGGYGLCGIILDLTVSMVPNAFMQPSVAVMSFSQRLNGEDEAAMMRLTEALVEGVIGMGGSFYLPYRLHARREQFRRAYPRADAFAAAKRRLDPRGVFLHALWDTWLAG